MTGVDANLVDDIFSEFFAYFGELVNAQLMKVCRIFYLV
jgi:hypothetical protein